MTTITPEHVNQLIGLESKVNYDMSPLKGEPFVIIDNESVVLISAPHGARTFRNNKEQVWHEEDEYTAGMALFLGEICALPVIATNYQNKDYDPNFTIDDNLPYKTALGDLIQRHHVCFVLDLHGAGLNSEGLEPQQTIDLGLRQKLSSDIPSMNLDHVQKLENLLSNTGTRCDASCFVTGRNKYPAAGEGTVTTFVAKQKILGTEKNVQAIQIEMKPQVRIASRFPTATLYKSCGPYQARVENVMHMLQSLVDFIDYLKEIKE